MGCCSGNSKSSEEKADSSGSKRHTSGTISYTYIPGAAKHTDFTSSQARTGWAPERFRKRHIAKSIYEKPSYVVLLHHGGKANGSKQNSFSACCNRGRKTVEQDNTGTASPVYATINKNNHKQPNKTKNYFGTS